MNTIGPRMVLRADFALKGGTPGGGNHIQVVKKDTFSRL